MTRKILILATLAALGAALALVLPATSSATTWDELPGLGFSVQVAYDSVSGCHYITATGHGQTADLGCDRDPGFQARLDALIAAAFPPPPPPTTTDPPATTTTTTTTAPSDPTPPPTDSTATTTAPASTVAAPATTTAAPVSAPSQTPVAAPAVQDAPATVDVSALESRIAALEAQIAALTTRVDRIALAGEASTAAFDQALADGLDVPTAASLARATYLNAEYGLGAYAS